MSNDEDTEIEALKKRVHESLRAPPMTVERVGTILASVTFAPSCVDMGWAWEVREVAEPSRWGQDAEQVGFLVRTTFRRPDRDTGEVATGFGRWWLVPSDVTESGVVKTAFAAAKMILEHELMESFRYEGVRIFDPHHTIEDLRVAAAHAGTWEIVKSDVVDTKTKKERNDGV